MADRYQDRPFPSADQARGESDPLAELARLIGQNDPLGAPAKPAPHPLQSRANVRPQQYDPPEEQPVAPPSPPAWMQRARHETPLPPPPLPQEYDDEPEYQQPAPVHPLHRYAAQPPQVPAHQAPPAQDYYEEPQQRYAEQPQQQYADEPQQDPSRYDDALYGRLETGEHDYQRDPAYPDDPYAYQGEYEEEPAPKKRSSGLMMVAAVLALAVVGTGGCLCLSHLCRFTPLRRAADHQGRQQPDQGGAGAIRRGRRQEPRPHAVGRWRREAGVARRDAGRRQFEVRRAARGVSAAEPERQPAAGLECISVGADGYGRQRHDAEQRAAQDQDARRQGRSGRQRRHSGRRQRAAEPPPTRGVAAPAVAPGPGPTTPPARNPASANASANPPMSLAPQADSPPPTRMAATNPAQTAAPAGGGYLVQVSSQKNEADAQASYRALQGKFPSVLGPHSSLVKRVDLGEKGVYYRAFAGPFGSSEEAAQVCSSLKSAGGQCFVQRN